VTIYNGDLALIHDRRHVALERGENRIAWRDVSANLDGTSSLLESISSPGTVSLLEQNFDFDLLKPSALLEKAVGSTVLVIHDHPLAGQPAQERAKLLSINDGLILQYADRIETSLYDSRIVYTSLPPNLRDRPTLVLDLDSASAGGQDLDLSYLTSGLGWHAEYVGQVSANDDRLDLNGKVTLTNTSGTSYENARLQLVAGNVNAPPPAPQMMRVFAEMSAAPTSRVTQENYFEYHLYTLNRPTTIAENQTKQVGFLTAHAVPIRKTLELRGGASYYRTNTPDLGAKLPISTYVSFDDKGGDLGVRRNRAEEADELPHRQRGSGHLRYRLRDQAFEREGCGGRRAGRRADPRRVADARRESAARQIFEQHGVMDGSRPRRRLDDA